MTMLLKTVCATGLALFSVLLTGEGFAQGQSERPTLAVVETQQRGAPRAEGSRAAGVLQREIQSVIRGTRRFTVLERDALVADPAFDEQALAESAMSQSEYAPTGQVEAAGYVVVPVITDYAIGARFEPLDAFPGRYNRIDNARLAAEIRVLRSDTLELVYVDEQNASYSNRIEAVEGRRGGPPASVMIDMAERLGARLAAGMVDYVFPVLVADVRGDVVLLNRGRGGIEVGDVFDIYPKGDAEPLIDPIDGTPLGGFSSTSLDPVARVRVVRVEPRFSVAELVSGDLSLITPAASALPVEP